MHSHLEAFCLFDLLLFTSGTKWRVAIPPIPPFSAPISESQPGTVMDVFWTPLNTSQNTTFEPFPFNAWYDEDSLYPNMNLTRFERGVVKCISQISKQTLHGSPDLCLFEQTKQTLEAIETERDQIRMSSTWMYLKPVLLAACTEGTCPSTADPAVYGATYFLRAFHSSVWSLLLLYILAVAGLLFVFEMTHDYRFFQTKEEPKTSENRLDLVDSLRSVSAAICLQSYNKNSKSWAGMVLTIFWYAFCLICVLTYAFGIAKLVFKTNERDDIHNKLFLSIDKNLSCERNSLWCETLKQRADLTVVDIDIPINTSRQTFLTESDSHLPLLVDHLTAKIISNQRIRVNDSGTRKTLKWVPALFNCPDGNDNYKLPSIPLAFVGKSLDSVWDINYRIEELRESGSLNQLAKQWESGEVQGIDLCRPTAAAEENAPIRMHQMNGPFLFMIIGALCSIVTHGAELFYYSVIKRKKAQNEPTDECDPEAALLR